jgi:hypothetical protein
MPHVNLGLWMAMRTRDNCSFQQTGAFEGKISTSNNLRSETFSGIQPNLGKRFASPVSNALPSVPLT